MKEVKAAQKQTDELVRRAVAQRIIYEKLITNREEGYEMDNENSIVISREELYNEIWSISLSKTAKKYNVPYSKLKRICEENNIPLPTQSYWGNLSVGKKVEKEPLSKSDVIKIILPIAPKKKTEHKTKIDITQKVNENVGQVSKVVIEDSPKIDNKEWNNALSFLPNNEKEKVIDAANNIKVVDIDDKLHKKLMAHKKTIKDWSKTHNLDPLKSRKKDWYSRKNENEPFMWGEISEETFPRVYRILDVLARCVENLGGIVNDNLSFTIRGDNVKYEITEGQDKAPHVLTKDEQKAKADRDRNGYGYVPQIRKWDYISNGKLKFTVGQKVYRDKATQGIESYLSDILIDIFVEAEQERLRKVVAEERRKQEEEERKLREEKRERRNKEVERVTALENEAEDYDTACKIRAYIAAVRANSEMTKEKEQWIDWANKKADWYDPTISRNDEYFGRREHHEDRESKQLKKTWYW